MEQLRIRADWFRKQGRLQDSNLEDIVNKIKADKQFKECKNSSRMALLKDEHRRVSKAVEEGLLQVHGTAPDTKQPGILRIMGENCNSFNNRIGGNTKIA
jgi:hypothetical protein